MLLINVSVMSYAGSLSRVLKARGLRAHSIRPEFAKGVSRDRTVTLVGGFLSTPSFFCFRSIVNFSPAASVSAKDFAIGEGKGAVRMHSVRINMVKGGKGCKICKAPMADGRFCSLEGKVILRKRPVCRRGSMRETGPMKVHCCCAAGSMGRDRGY